MKTFEIRCAQDKHLELHRILSIYLKSGGFMPYKIAVKVGCPQTPLLKIIPKESQNSLSYFSFKIRGFLRRIGFLYRTEKQIDILDANDTLVNVSCAVGLLCKAKWVLT